MLSPIDRKYAELERADPALFAGTTFAQAAALRSMLGGNDTVITGAGGTGKTMVMTRWLAHKIKTEQVKVHFVSLFPNPSLPAAEHFRYEDLAQAAAAAEAYDGPIILAIDEYGHLPEIDFLALSAYDQIVATGDPIQDTSSNGCQSTEFVSFISTIGGDLHQLDIAFRATHLGATNLIDGFYYQGQHASHPAWRKHFGDVLKFTTVTGDKLETALKILARLVRFHNLNAKPKFSCWVALRDQEIIENLRKLAPFLPFNKRRPLKFQIIDPNSLQGLETDILMVYAPDLDKICTTPQTALRAVVTLLGRANVHLEVIFETSDRGAKRTSADTRYFSDLFQTLLNFEPYPALKTTSADIIALEHRIKDLGLTLLPVSDGLLVYNKSDNRAEQIIAPIADGDETEPLIRQALHIALYQQRGWQIEPIVEAGVGAYQTDTPRLAQLAKPITSKNKASGRG